MSSVNPKGITPDPAPTHPPATAPIAKKEKTKSSKETKMTDATHKRMANASQESFSKRQKIESPEPKPLSHVENLTHDAATAIEITNEVEALLSEFRQTFRYIRDTKNYPTYVDEIYQNTDHVDTFYKSHPVLTQEQMVVRDRYEKFIDEVALKHIVFDKVMEEENIRSFGPFHTIAQILDFLDFILARGENKFLEIKKNYLELLDVYIATVENQEDTQEAALLNLNLASQEIVRLGKEKHVIPQNRTDQFKSLIWEEDTIKPISEVKPPKLQKPQPKMAEAGGIDVGTRGKSLKSMKKRASSAFSKVKRPENTDKNENIPNK